jgi:hypothetical protein
MSTKAPINSQHQKTADRSDRNMVVSGAAAESGNVVS